MGRQQPHNNSQHGQGETNQTYRFDEDRRVARRKMWAQAAAAAGYGDQPATSGRGGAA